VIPWLLIGVAAAASWGADFDARTATPDELVFAATRYGSTDAKRRDKELARTELFARRGEGLRLLMERVHVENIMIGVYAQEMVEQFHAGEVAPVLMDFVDTAPTNARRMAVFLLGFHPEPDVSARPRLRALLSDDSLQGVSARTLGKWRDTNAVPRIIHLLTSPKERIRVTAANALRDIGDPRAMPPLVEALGDPVFTVRNTAQRALVAFGPPASDVLLRALPTSRAPARMLIIEALGELQAGAARRPLARQREMADEAERAAIDRALARIPRSGWSPW
jgi:hypothetical protein